MSDVLTEARNEVAAAVESGLGGRALVDAIMLRLCRRIGGNSVYWPRVDVAARNAAMRGDLAAGFGRDEVCRRNGVSRKTLDKVLDGGT